MMGCYSLRNKRAITDVVVSLMPTEKSVPQSPEGEDSLDVSLHPEDSSIEEKAEEKPTDMLDNQGDTARKPKKKYELSYRLIAGCANQNEAEIERLKLEFLHDAHPKNAVPLSKEEVSLTFISN